MMASAAPRDAAGRDNGSMAGRGRVRWRRLAAGACLVLVAGGCTSGGPTRAPGPAAPSVASGTAGVGEPALVAGATIQLSCETSIVAAPSPPEDYRLPLPGVALPVGRVLDVNETGAAEPTNRLFAKWGLVVHAGTAVDLQLVHGWEDRARIRWGSSVAPGVAVHVPACRAPDGQPQWLHFAGGTWVTQPACVPLTVRALGQVVRVSLGVGVACDP